MFSHKKLLIGFGAALVLVTALAVSTAVAQTPTPKAKPGANNIYQNFLDRLAGNLHIGIDDLTQAIKTTRDQILDEAVQDGKITKEQADKIKERTQNGNLVPLPKGQFGFKGHLPGKAIIRLPAFGNVTVEALAQLAGKTVDQVKEELKADKNIQKFLDANNITRDQLRDAVVQITQQKLDQAVKDGKMTAEQAQRMLDRMKQSPLNGLGPKGFMPRGRGPAPSPTP